MKTDWEWRVSRVYLYQEKKNESPIRPDNELERDEYYTFSAEEPRLKLTSLLGVWSGASEVIPGTKQSSCQLANTRTFMLEISGSQLLLKVDGCSYTGTLTEGQASIILRSTSDLDDLVQLVCFPRDTFAIFPLQIPNRPFFITVGYVVTESSFVRESIAYGAEGNKLTVEMCLLCTSCI
mmetsp:Transcript_46383/g.75706  ORF Transcript_46383/g.75706 Transcript_46383/m.75706 type:complete len:180 (+) Transcript_46383:436-975(+)